MPGEESFLILYSWCFIHNCITKTHTVYVFWTYVLLEIICKHVATTEVHDKPLISWHTLQGTNQFGGGLGYSHWKLLHPSEARRSISASSPNVPVHAPSCCCSLPPLNSAHKSSGVLLGFPLACLWRQHLKSCGEFVACLNIFMVKGSFIFWNAGGGRW